jgi:hypothetical protein
MRLEIRPAGFAVATVGAVTVAIHSTLGGESPWQKVFIVTRQQKDGWEGYDQETSEIVPEKPAEQQAENTPVLSL